ncbi:DUF1062 domain-containing protein [Virgibacillus oceani]|uniref:DUF1062 domain-containing protein n=1 Tax=Virgibacillus oceani TaxID=1479511 RepID=A0A917M4B1_9BACI|nr:DUF1062 domain-containing protein [Virgibacillus oceani]GGG76783.1 hypothetical protein GCM10011398_22270 [Virgibacillus oceani]
MSLNAVTYEIVAQETPNVIRNCRNCKRSTEYFCSDKFRVNANQKIVDIWLIYKCIHCEGTWNCPILSRLNVNRIDPILHQKYMNNDKETIWHHAFQISKLRKLCDAVKNDINYEVRKEKSESVSDEATIRICCKYDFGLRIDKLLAEILDISRSKVSKMAKEETFLLYPTVSMKDKVIDDLQITVKGNRRVFG